LYCTTDNSGHATYTGERQHVTGFGGGNPKERDHLKDLGVDERILKWIFK
jgi:hypothetical protein